MIGFVGIWSCSVCWMLTYSVCFCHVFCGFGVFTVALIAADPHFSLLASETFHFSPRRLNWFVSRCLFLMGNVASIHRNESKTIRRPLMPFIGQLRGAIGSATVIGCWRLWACAIWFVGCSALTMGKGRVREMDRFQYDKRLSTALLLQVGTLGDTHSNRHWDSLFYAILTEQKYRTIVFSRVLFFFMQGIMFAVLFQFLVIR